MHPPPAAAAVVAPPAAAGGAAAAGRPARRWWQPDVCRGALARAQLVIAAAAAAFAIFASTLRPADFPYVTNLPPPPPPPPPWQSSFLAIECRLITVADDRLHARRYRPSA
jgi:hypothetical protein